MKKIHMIAALLAMLLPTVTWGWNASYYAKVTVGLTSASTGAGKVYAGNSENPSASSYFTETKSVTCKVDKSGTSGSAPASADVSIYLSAKAGYGFKFDGWYDNASGTGTAKSSSADYSFTKSSSGKSESDAVDAGSYYAKFVENTFYAVNVVKPDVGLTSYTITGPTGFDGSGLSNGGELKAYADESYDFKCTVADGYEFVKWTVNGADAGTSTTLTKSFTAASTVQAVVNKLVTYYATCQAVPAGCSYKVGSTTVSSSEYQTSGYGTLTVNLSAPTAASGYMFAGWYEIVDGNKTIISTDASTTVTKKSDVTLGADFVAITAPVMLATSTGSVDYEDLDAAFEAAKAGDAISVFTDSAINGNAVVYKGSTLNLAAGVTVTVNGTLAVAGTVAGSGTIAGNGTLYKISYLIDQGEVITPTTADGAECGTMELTNHTSKKPRYRKTTVTSNSPSVSGTISCVNSFGVLLNGNSVYQIDGSPKALKVNFNTSSAVNEISSITGSAATTSLADDANWLLLADCSLSGPTYSGDANRLNYQKTVDCAGKKLTMGKSRTYSSFGAIFLNGTISFQPSTDFQNAPAAFFGCSAVTIERIKGTTSPKFYFYDCGTEDSPATLSFKYVGSNGSGNNASASSAGYRTAYFYCGYYNYSFTETNDKTTGKSHVYGGSFKADPSEYDCVPDKYNDVELTVAPKDSKGFYKVVVKGADVVENEAEIIGGLEYPTLAEAVAAANSGDVIKLLTGVVIDDAGLEIPGGKVLTIVLNGHTISGGKITNRGTVTITEAATGSCATIETVAEGKVESAVDNYGVLDFVFGTYDGAIANKSGGSLTTHNGLFNKAISNEGGTVSLRGGHFKAAVFTEEGVSALAANGFEVIALSGWYNVVEPPNGTLVEKTVSNKPGYCVTPYRTSNPDEYTMMRGWGKNNKTLRTDYSSADWARVAELLSFYQLYRNNVLDTTLFFDRTVASGSITLRTEPTYNITPSYQINAGSTNRLLTAAMIGSGQASTGFAYYRFFAEQIAVSSVAYSLADNTGANAGTVCRSMIEIWGTGKEGSRTVTNTLYVVGQKLFTINAGSNAAMIRPETGAATFYQNLSGENSAVAAAITGSNKKIMLANDCSQNLALTSPGTYTFDTMGFAYTGGEPTVSDGLFVKSETTVDSSAKVLVPDAKATTYVVAQKVASVGGTFYDNLTEAVGAANGATVTLLAATDETITLGEGQTLSLNKNGIAFDDAKVMTSVEGSSVKATTAEGVTVYSLVKDVVTSGEAHYPSIEAAIAAAEGNTVAVTVVAADTETIDLDAGKTLVVTVADGVTANVTVDPGEGAFIDTTTDGNTTTYESKKITVEMATPQATVEVKKIDHGTESAVTDTAEINAAVNQLMGNHDVPRTDNTDKLDVLDVITVTPTKIVEDVTSGTTIIRSATFDVVPHLNAGQSLTEGQKLKFRLPVDASATQLAAIVYHGDAQFGIYPVQTYNDEKFVEVESNAFSPYGYELLDGETANPIAAIGTTGYATLPDAIVAASNGDTITVFAGTFDIASDTIVVNKQVTITGAGKDTTTLNSTATGKAAFSIQASNVTIENMTINQADTTTDNTLHVAIAYTGSSASPTVAYSDITLQNLKFTGSKYSVSVYAEDLTIDSCDFVNPASDAILLYCVKGDSKITNNTFTQSTAKGQGFIYGTTASGNDYSSGTLTISGNTASGGRCFYHCNNQDYIDTTTKLTLTITDNEIIGYNNKAIVFAGHSDIPLGNIFNSITITENAFYTTAKRPTIQRDDTDKSSLAINASGNYWGAATPDFESVIPGTADKYLIVPPTDNNVIVDSYYQAYDENTDTLSNLYTVPRVAQNKTTGVKYESLAAAVAAATSGDTIEMLADDRLSEELAIDRSVTITGAVDSEGKPLYTIYGKPTDNYNVDIFVKNASSAIDVTIQNVNISEFGHQYKTSTGNAALYVSRSTHADTHVLVSNVTFSAYNNYAIIAPQGHLEVVDCAINGYKDSSYGTFATGGIWSGDMFDDLPSSTVSVVRTSIINTDSNMPGVTGYAIDARAGSTVTVTDCTITNVHDGIAAAASQESGSGDASVSVSGTTVKAGRNALAITGNPQIADTVLAYLEVTSGTFVGAVTIPDEFVDDGIIEISGGYFDREVFEEYCADGYIPTPQDPVTGMYTVKQGSYVAQIGTTKYESFAEAIEAAEEYKTANGDYPVITVLDATAAQDNADWIFVTDSSVEPAVTTLVRRLYYNVWVGGTRIAADNAADVFGDGKVSYDDATKTLTLNGYTYSGAGYDSSAVYIGDVGGATFNVVVAGENSLTSTAAYGYAIRSVGTGAVTVTGSGSDPSLALTVPSAYDTGYAVSVKGTSATFKDLSMSVTGYLGIVVNGNNAAGDALTIDNCDLVFDGTAIDQAIWVFNEGGDGTVSIENGSSLTGKGAILVYGYGTSAGDANLSISDSTVSLTGATTASEPGSSRHAIEVLSNVGDSVLTIDNSTVTVTASNGLHPNGNGPDGINVGSQMSANGKGVAKIDIKNGSVVTATGNANGVNLFTWGDSSNVNPCGAELSVVDSTLNASATHATGGHYGIVAYAYQKGDTSVVFENSTVNASAPASAGIYVGAGEDFNADVGSLSYVAIDSDVTTSGPYGLVVSTVSADGNNTSVLQTVDISGGSFTCNGLLFVYGDDGENTASVSMSDVTAQIGTTTATDEPVLGTVTTGELSIDSGDYTILHAADLDAFDVADGNISGGNFNEKVPEELCADGYIPTELDPVTGRYTVKQGAFVARNVNTGVGYETLYSAVAAATAGDMVTLLTNVTESLTISKDLTLTGDWTITGSTRFDAGATVTISNLTFDANGVIYAMNIAGGSTVDLQNATVGGGQWCNIHLNNGTLTGSGVTMKGDQIVVAADGQTYTYRGETYQASDAPWGLDVTKVPGKTLNVPYMDIVREGDTDTITLSDSEQKQLTPAGSILFVSNMPEDETLTGVTLPARFSSYTLTLDADVQFFGGADKPVTGWAVGNWNEIIDTGAVVLQALDENPAEVPVELELNNDVDLGDGDSGFEFRYPNLTIDGNGNAVSGTIKYTDNAGIVSNVVLGTESSPIVLDMTGVTKPIEIGSSVVVSNVTVQMTAEQATAGTPVIIWDAAHGVDAPENEAGVTVALVDGDGNPTGDEAGLIWDDEMGMAYIGPAEARLTGPTHETPIYTTLANAIAWAAQSGDTVTLLMNVSNVTGTITIDKSLTLDGGSNTISAAAVPADGHRNMVDAFMGGTSMLKIEGDVTLRNITLDGDATHRYTYLVSADNSSAKLTTSNVRLLNGGELAGDANGAILEQGAGYGAGIHLNNGAQLVVSNGFYACTGGPDDGVFPFTGILPEGGSSVSFELTGNPNDPANVDIGSDLLLVGMVGVIPLDQVQGVLNYMKVPSRFIPYTLTLGDGSAYAFTGASPRTWNDIIDYGKEIMDVSTAIGYNGLDKTSTPVEVGLLTDTVLPDTFRFADTNFTVNGNGYALAGTIEYTDNAGLIHDIVMGTDDNALVLDMTGVTQPIRIGSGIVVDNVTVEMTAEQATAGTPVIIWDAAHGVDAPENEAGVTVQIVDDHGDSTGVTKELIWDDEMGMAYIGPVEARLTGPTHDKPIYTTLADAIARAEQTGDTVTLMMNVTNVTATYEISKQDLVIDGAGHKVTAAPVTEHRNLFEAWGGSRNMFKVESGDVTFRNIELDGDASHAYTFLISADNSGITLTTENVRLVNGGEQSVDSDGVTLTPGNGYGAAIHLNNGANIVVSNGFYACTGGRTAGCFPFTAILVDEGGADVKFELTGNPNDPANVDIGDDLLLVGMLGDLINDYGLDAVQGMLSEMQVPTRFIPYTLTLADGSAYAFTGASPRRWNDIIDYGKDIMDVATANGFSGLDKDTTPVEVGLATDTILPAGADGDGYDFLYEDSNFSINGNGNALSGTIKFTDDADGGLMRDIELGTETNPLTLDLRSTDNPVVLGEDVVVQHVDVLMTEDQATLGKIVFEWDSGETPPDDEQGVEVTVVDGSGNPTGETKGLVWDEEYGVAYIGPVEARLTGTTHETPVYTSLANALDIAKDNDKVELLTNAVLSAVQGVGSDVTLDLAGYKVSVNGEKGLMVTNATLVIADTSAATNGTICAADGASPTSLIESGDGGVANIPTGIFAAASGGTVLATSGTGTIAVSGGYFSVEVSAEYCASGYAPMNAPTGAPQPYTVGETVPEFRYPIDGSVGVPVERTWLATYLSDIYSDPTKPVFANVTNDLVQALSENGANDMPRWESYVLGLNPTDVTARLRLTATSKDAATVTIIGLIDMTKFPKPDGTTITFRLAEVNLDGTKKVDLVTDSDEPSFDVLLEDVVGKELAIFADISVEGVAK